MGDKVVEKEIPAELAEDAKKYHAELIEKDPSNTMILPCKHIWMEKSRQSRN